MTHFTQAPAGTWHADCVLKRLPRGAPILIRPIRAQRGLGSLLAERLAEEARRLEQRHAGSGVDELVLDLAA